LPGHRGHREVDQCHPAVGQHQDVVGVEVLVDHTAGVQLGQAVYQSQGQREEVGVLPVPQGLAAEILEDQDGTVVPQRQLQRRRRAAAGHPPEHLILVADPGELFEGRSQGTHGLQHHRAVVGRAAPAPDLGGGALMQQLEASVASQGHRGTLTG